ncbi:SMP protein, partial [Atlantisia rogersi]|nr:SMP protein [Atlantisia rogersi]
GTPIELGCQAEGRPPPLLSWFRGVTVLGEEPVSTSLPLVLPRARPQDAGVYSCVAENRHGRHNRSLELHVACEAPQKQGGTPKTRGAEG